MLSMLLSYVPYYQHTDPTRLQMASAHLKQAVNLVNPQLPIVISSRCPRLNCKVEYDELLYSLYDGIIVRKDDMADFIKFDSYLNYSYIPYELYDTYAKPQSVTEDGIPLLGTNLLTVITTYHGYNYEDAIVISESAAEKLSHWNWREEIIELKDRWTLLPVTNEKDEFDIPVFDVKYVEKDHPYLRILKGTILDIEEKIAEYGYHLLWEFNTNKKTILPAFNTFLKKMKIKIVDMPISFNLNKRLLKERPDIRIVKVWQQPAKEGDKLANRHGNKGVICKILPDDKMPKTNYGIADIVINPLGIISRMNIGQLFEIHLTKLIYDIKQSGRDDLLDILVEKFGYDGSTNTICDVVKWEDMKQLFAEIGKRPVDEIYDPIIECKKTATVGWCYWMKLHHLVESKFSCRQFGGEKKGQRFGEMETWTMIAYDATDVMKRMFRCLTDSPEKYKLFSQLMGFEIPDFKNTHNKSVHAVKFSSFMKVLGIDIDAAYNAYIENHQQTEEK